MYNINAFFHLNFILKTADLGDLIRRAEAENPWFTEEGIQLAVTAISEKMLAPEKLGIWLKRYPYHPDFQPKNIGIIMAGNIPLVGFFDLLCVCIAGHHAYIKMSSKDRVLTQFVVDVLQQSEHPPVIVPLTDSSPLDAVIATGSDNTNRYFRAHYEKIPHLLRGSRTSIAVLTGDETEGDLRDLSHDIFDYFGMGCRSVAKIFVPADYDLEKLVGVLKKHNIKHSKYLSAHRNVNSLLRIRNINLYDGAFFTLHESADFPEALSDLVYTKYKTLDAVKEWISLNDSEIQCIVARNIDHPRRVDFGQAQWPELWDYPDGQDVMAFLSTIQ